MNNNITSEIIVNLLDNLIQGKEKERRNNLEVNL